MVREGRREDFGSATELLNHVWPHRVGSERGLRHAADAAPPDAHRRYWAAEDGAKLVGWATAAIEYQSAERPGFLDVSVAPEARKAGLGTALLERCEDHLAGLGVATVLSITTPEEASQRLAAAHGFRHTNTTRISGVDPRTIEPGSVPPGVSLHPLASLDPRKVYELDAEAGQVGLAAREESSPKTGIARLRRDTGLQESRALGTLVLDARRRPADQLAGVFGGPVAAVRVRRCRGGRVSESPLGSDSVRPDAVQQLGRRPEVLAPALTHHDSEHRRRAGASRYSCEATS